MANDNIENLTPCDQALATRALQLSGEELPAGDVQRAEEHIAGCSACRQGAAETAQALSLTRNAFAGVRVSAGFAAKTMAALPKSAGAPVSGQQTQVRVFASAPERTFSWRAAAVAASVALLAVGGILAVTLTKSRQIATGIGVANRGTLVDGSGNKSKAIQVGMQYKASEDTLLSVEKEGTLNVLKGSRFQFREGDSNGAAEMELQSGDVYAQATGAEGVRVSCANFDTEIPEGDCFVTQETDSVPRGVVIVFTGHARVTPNLHAALPLKSGQVFFSVGEGASAFIDTLDIGDVPKLITARDNEAVIDNTTLRKQYAERVEGYKQELAELKKQDAQKKADDAQKAELSVRVERINSYLHVHELRLKSLAQADTPGRGIPLGEIERGINGHTDPRTWR